MLHPKKILTIFWKDFRDAVRDARILMALAVPLGLGLFYNFIFDDDEPTPEATVVYLAPDTTMFPSALTEVVGDAVDLTLRQGSSAAGIQQQVGNEDADVGIVLPPGFDAAVRRDEQPSLTVFVRESPGLGASYVVASLEETLRGMAGQQQPAVVTVEEVADEPEGIEAVIEELGLRRWMVLSMVVFLIGMVSMFAVPVILTEETEKRTLDALTIIASTADVVAAKALVGLAYVAIMVPLMLIATRLQPANAMTFTAGIVLTSLMLIGFGLLLGGLFRTVAQLNTWSSIAILLVTFPVFMVALPLPDALATVIIAFPTAQAMRLLSNGLAGSEIYTNAWLAYPIILVWSAAVYGLLLWRLSRQEA